MILIGIIVSTILWADLKNIYIWIVLFVCTSLGLLGFLDDYLKNKIKKFFWYKCEIKIFWTIYDSFNSNIDFSLFYGS